MIGTIIEMILIANGILGAFIITLSRLSSLTKPDVNSLKRKRPGILVMLLTGQNALMVGAMIYVAIVGIPLFVVLGIISFIRTRKFKADINTIYKIKEWKGVEILVLIITIQVLILTAVPLFIMTSLVYLIRRTKGVY